MDLVRQEKLIFDIKSFHNQATHLFQEIDWYFFLFIHHFLLYRIIYTRSYKTYVYLVQYNVA